MYVIFYSQGRSSFLTCDRQSELPSALKTLPSDGGCNAPHRPRSELSAVAAGHSVSGPRSPETMSTTDIPDGEEHSSNATHTHTHHSAPRRGRALPDGGGAAAGKWWMDSPGRAPRAEPKRSASCACETAGAGRKSGGGEAVAARSSSGSSDGERGSSGEDERGERGSGLLVAEACERWAACRDTQSVSERPGAMAEGERDQGKGKKQGR